MFSQASLLSLYYPVSNAEMKNPLAHPSQTFYVILYAPYNQANVKSKNSSVSLHVSVHCKSMQMNGANHILEVLTSTDVRLHQLPVCGTKCSFYF
jgi:hypothetical protein